jgi:2'-5' RNA ligase
MLASTRALIAVNLDVASVRKLADIQRTLRASPLAPCSGVTWICPASLFVPVRDLGIVDTALAPALLDPVRELIVAQAPLQVHLGPIGSFPDPSLARIIMVEATEPSGVLVQLADRLGVLAASLGLPPDRHLFRPHVTLARLPEPMDTSAWLASVDAPPVGDARITECVCYRDEILRPGFEHTVLGRFAWPVPQPARSQRPSRAPKASQRPSRRPRTAEGSVLATGTGIPPPPKLPSMQPPELEPGRASGGSAVQPLGQSQSAPEAAATQDGPVGSGPVRRSSESLLPPAVQAALPPDDEWGD